MATIKDVAKYAKVSHGTVSNVLNGVSSVSLENIKKVEEAIRVLGYKPNMSARNLKSNKSRDIAVILPNITDSWYAALYTTMENLLYQKNFNLHLYTTNDIVEKEKQILNEIYELQTCSTIIVTCQPDNTEMFCDLLQNGMKFVFVDREPKGIDCNFVGFRNDKSVQDAVNELMDGGAQCIGLITSLQSFSCEALCIEGFTRAMAERHTEIDPSQLRITAGTREDGFKAAIELINEIGIDAIICSNSLLLYGVTRAIHLTCSKNQIRVIALGDDSWNREIIQNTAIIPRPYFKVSSEILNLLTENLENPAFFEYRQIYLDHADRVRAFSEKNPHCRRSDSGRELRIAMVDGEMALSIQRLLPDLQHRTGMRVILDVLPYEVLYESIDDSSKRCKYDLFSIDASWFPEFIEKSYLADITAYIDQEFIRAVNIRPDLWNGFSKVGDRYFAVPYHHCNQLLFYRKDLFENAVNRRMFYEQYHVELRCPRTWLEFNAVAKFFTRKFNSASETVYGTTLGGDYPNAAAYDFLPRLWAYGGDIFDKHGKVSINSKNAVKALENYCESYQYASSASSTNWLYGQINEFISGEAAMMILSSAYASSISSPGRSKVAGKVGFEQVPGGKTVHWVWTFAVNNDSIYKEDAISFVRWICDKELAVPTTLLGNISACLDVCTSTEIFTRYPWIVKSLNTPPEQMLKGFPENHPLISAHSIIDAIAHMVHDCVSEKVPADAALKNMADALSDIAYGKKLT